MCELVFVPWWGQSQKSKFQLQKIYIKLDPQGGGGGRGYIKKIQTFFSPSTPQLSRTSVSPYTSVFDVAGHICFYLQLFQNTCASLGIFPVAVLLSPLHCLFVEYFKLKGLDHEMEFKFFDKNEQFQVHLRTSTGFLISKIFL